MIISIHQPHYLPWVGYFNKIVNSDAFVFLDNAQFEKGGFQNRNKIRTKHGWIWLTVPVITKGKLEQRIKDVKINNVVKWQKSHLQSIEMNYSKTKYFSSVYEVLKGFYEKDWDRLVDINVHLTKCLLEYLEIKVPVYFESELDIEGEKTQRIINICKKLNADQYLSGIGAKDYLIEGEFSKHSIKLVYQEFKHPVYNQVYPNFKPNMSIIDLLFNCGKDSKKYVTTNTL